MLEASQFARLFGRRRSLAMKVPLYRVVSTVDPVTPYRRRCMLFFAPPFSSIPGRSLRGERRTDDRFFRDSNLDDEDNTQAKQVNMDASNVSANRPLRGERLFNRSGSLPSSRRGEVDIHTDDPRTARKEPEKFPNQMNNMSARRDGAHNRFDLFSFDKLDRHGKRDEGIDKNDRNIASRVVDRVTTGEKGEREGHFGTHFKIDTDKSEYRKKEALQNSSDKIMETVDVATDASPQNADEIFKKMKETGLIPNAVAMLDGLCKDGLVQEAMKLFQLMREKGTIPEVVVYTAVVEGFLTAQKYEDATRIFRKMQNNGIAPNAFSYKIMIQGLSKGAKWEESVDFSVEMLEAGHSPNIATFVTLVDGFHKEKGVEEAEGIVNRLKEKGFTINEKVAREYLDKKGPYSPSVWEIIFGKKGIPRVF